MAMSHPRNPRISLSEALKKHTRLPQWHDPFFIEMDVVINAARMAKLAYEDGKYPAVDVELARIKQAYSDAYRMHQEK